MSTPTGLKASPFIAAAVMGAAGTALAADGIELSGQISPALMYANDGNDSKAFFVDNANSNSRFRLKGTRTVSSGLEAGFLLEMAYPSNPSSSVNFANRSIDAELGERHINAFLKGSFGMVSLGQGDGAANGGMEVDLSGTSIVTYSGMNDIGGGILFKDAAGADGPAIGSTLGNLDFESRYDRLRYDTPSLGPVGLAFSFGAKGGNDVYEIAARPKLKLGGGNLQAAIGYSVEDKGGTAGNETTVGGSLSYAMASGLNATLAYATQGTDDPARADKKYTYVKLGYKSGAHAFSVDYGMAKDFAARGDDATGIGLGYVYTAAKWLELYGGAKQHKLDRAGAGFDTVMLVTTGARIKF